LGKPRKQDYRKEFLSAIMDSGSFIGMCGLFGFTPDRIARIVQDEAVRI
jgi:hypothetical protein